MTFLLFSVSLFFIVTATALFLTRSRWRQLLPSIQLPGATYIYSRLPTTFAGDIEAGLSSDTFNLHGNIEDGDGRAGLDGAAKAEVLKIMKKKRLNFDQARKTYMENRFKENGIDADGRPRDPKFVSFS